VESKSGRIRRVRYWEAILVISRALSVSIVRADDFKTIDGKEYKNATVNRVEPDGLVLRTKSGISKVYFTALDREGHTIWIVDAHRDRTRFIVRADEKLTAFLELERDVCIHLLTERANDLDCINPNC
jgi:hypothetical protein